MVDKISHNHVIYIHERGFKVVENLIPEHPDYPYLLLKNIQTKKSNSTIEYHPSKSFSKLCEDNFHPSINSIEDLVYKIENIIASTKIYENKLFTTKKEKKITIYVEDKSWKETTDRLEDIYK